MARPIRNGCWVKWKTIEGDILEGEVVANWYTDETYHQYTIRLADGRFYYTNGAILYRNQIEHRPGKISRKAYKKSCKKYLKSKKVVNQYYEQRKNKKRAKSNPKKGKRRRRR